MLNLLKIVLTGLFLVSTMVMTAEAGPRKRGVRTARGIKSGEIPATKVHTLRHVGSYVHLGNAWTTLYSMQRNKEFKSAKGIHPFETYVNMPGQVPDKDLITDIHFPVK